MSTMRINCLSYDHDQLDRSVSKILAAIPAGEVRDIDVSIGPKIGGAQTRWIQLDGASEKIAGILARIDVPKSVDVRVRTY